MIGLFDVLVAVKNAMSRAPTSTVSYGFSGRNFHGMCGATLVSKSTRIWWFLIAPGATVPRCVVPFRPVAWQNIRYKGMLAQPSPLMKQIPSTASSAVRSLRSIRAIRLIIGAASPASPP